MSSNNLSDHKSLTKNLLLIAGFITFALLIPGCSQPPAEGCAQLPQADLSGALAYAEDDELDFQFPLPELGIVADPNPAIFEARGGKTLADSKYHAAEDYHLSAGTPVYAFADGIISFSGRMNRYGWLIIIDHPQKDIYSLYGHLSPSRWYLKSGAIVEKGDLIAYLGDDDENGGSKKNPMVTHLHFGIRVGQRVDYAGIGELRWMAGWIKPCPSDAGWLRPSEIITSQEIPPGGFPVPELGFFEKWGGEIILGSIYLLAGVCIFITSWKKGTPTPLLLYGIAMIAAGWYFSIKGTRMQYAIYMMAGVSLIIFVYKFLQGRKKRRKS